MDTFAFTVAEIVDMHSRGMLAVRRPQGIRYLPCYETIDNVRHDTMRGIGKFILCDTEEEIRWTADAAVQLREQRRPHLQHPDSRLL